MFGKKRAEKRKQIIFNNLKLIIWLQINWMQNIAIKKDCKAECKVLKRKTKIIFIIIRHVLPKHCFVNYLIGH